MEHSADNKRIAVNTLYLYVRSLLIMVVSLYTSRVVLNALGDVDYGIYNLVASVVVMFSVFSATFTSTTQRFLNVEHGRGDRERARKVFSASLNIFLLLSALFVVIAETVGLWFLNHELNIPAESMGAANVVYQLSVVTFVINLISIPYNAAIIANERMNVFAIVSVYEALMKLAVAFMVISTPFDRLVTYAVLIMLIAVSVRIFYGRYCVRYIDECRYSRVGDCSLYREIFALSGWNFLGSGASILTLNGIGIIVNMFTNILANTAKGIASQVENAVTQLVTNFMTSLRPQITKSYASGDYDYMLQLVDRGTRMSFFLTCAICFPIIFEADNILRIWLGEVPEYAVGFVQLTLIYLIQNAFST
ncbi:MAG: lipopolysaccharide biosynthesis protein, partial [Muribaculum sp.]|nr:lipopolysaccharide biosynthesis protein [Muribaculum sp.]